MTENNWTESYDDGTDGEQQSQGRNPLREELNRATTKAKTLESQLSEAQKATRKLAFYEAGVNMQHPMAQYFVNGYDGDLSAEAIKAAAESAGLAATPAAPATPEVTAQAEQDRQVFQQTPQLTQEGTPAAGRNWDAEINSAQSAEEVQRIYRERYGADSVKDD